MLRKYYPKHNVGVMLFFLLYVISPTFNTRISNNQNGNVQGSMDVNPTQQREKRDNPGQYQIWSNKVHNLHANIKCVFLQILTSLELFQPKSLSSEPTVNW